MKNNKYIFTLLAFCGIMLLNACEENLEIKPAKELASNYFETEDQMMRAVGGIYASLAEIYGPQLNDATQYPMWLLPGDDLTSDGSGNTFETFSGLNGSNGRVEGMWKRYYQTVARANVVLEKINTPEVSAIFTTPGLRNANEGEALFLRSWVFYNLWDKYRKAPVQDERIELISDAILPPSEDFELLDNAIASLEKAAELLPASWDQNNLGRITKDGAYGLLVKCYVLRACYNGKNNEDYGKAIAAFNKISESRQLVNFGENFDYRYENNAESLFEYQASHAPAQDNAWLPNSFGGDVGQMGAFYHYYNTHWGNYSSGIIGPTQKLVGAFEEGDPRIAETLTDNADNLNWKLWWVAPTWDKFNGYQMVKYIKGERGNLYDKTWKVSSGNNPRILRLGDVKLAVAEAYLATGDAGNALKQVNDIRERARKSTPDGVESAVPAALGAVTMQDIMDERLVELAGEEGHRWTDLRRWHAAGYINLASWSATDFGFPSKYDASLFKFDVNKHLLYPIPVSELNSNPEMAASGNNPGY
ncbi:MAG: RagB/SusD family nutrient uptake outer membrane protein [Cyclobacteriaceae bacterium]|nr:RagB/SusD family nutrient uptake outer membrane protein [Cyclobacteriaceae bacterium]